MKILIVIIAIMQAVVAYAQDSTSDIKKTSLAKDLTTDINKTNLTNNNYISGYVGMFNFLKHDTSNCLCDSDRFTYYNYERATFGIGIGHDFSKNKSLELRYSSVGRLNIVTKVGSYFRYFFNKINDAHSFKSADNKMTVDISLLELNYKWYYHNFSFFKRTTYNGDLAFGLGAGAIYYMFKFSLKDGDYYRSQNNTTYSFILTPLIVSYRMKNYLISASYNTDLFLSEYYYFGFQYYFN